MLSDGHFFDAIYCALIMLLIIIFLFCRIPTLSLIIKFTLQCSFNWNDNRTQRNHLQEYACSCYNSHGRYILFVQPDNANHCRDECDPAPFKPSLTSQLIGKFLGIDIFH